MFAKLLDISLFAFEDKDAVREAVDLYRTGKGDFADYLVGVRSRNAGSVTMVTFDEALHAHPDLFSSPAAALRKSKSTARRHTVRRSGDCAWAKAAEQELEGRRPWDRRLQPAE